jgi:hypothetical protein
MNSAVIGFLMLAATGADSEKVAAIHAAGVPYAVCMVEAARAIDDNSSDAATIAKAIELSCPAQFRVYLDAIETGDDAYMRTVDEELAPDIRKDMALKAVLGARKLAARKHSN